MRYEDWDILLFPRDCKVPFKEFKVACSVVHDIGRIYAILHPTHLHLADLRYSRVRPFSWVSRLADCYVFRAEPGRWKTFPGFNAFVGPPSY